ncbi:MAG: AI-2E family transporter [Bacteroidales bacterium]|nr:AI-2E family transporter [Bacteroidales bacterium]MBO5916654.1 AI-2E family transporter [Bacteroidales bacterium]
MNTPKPYTFDRVVRMLISLAVIVGIGLLINRLSAVLLPFFIAWLLAYLIYPLVCFFQYKLKFKYRILAIVSALISVVAIIAAAILVLQAPMRGEMQRLTVACQEFLNQSDGRILPDSWMNAIKDFVAGINIQSLLTFDTIEKTLSKLLPGAWSLISSSFSFIWGLLASVFVLLYLVFILLDYEKLSDGFVKIIPLKYRRFATELSDDLKNGMNAYFRGQAMVALCVGILFAIGFRCIGLPMGIGFGLFVGVLNLVPYLQAASIPFAIVLGLIKVAESGQSFWVVALLITLVYVVVQSTQDFFIVPKIMGNTTGLKPAIILLSLSIFGSLFGLIGMIIALPLTTLIISYYQRFVIAQESIEDEFYEEEISTETTDN